MDQTATRLAFKLCLITGLSFLLAECNGPAIKQDSKVRRAATSKIIKTSEKFDLIKFKRGQKDGIYQHTDKNGNEVQEFGDPGSEYICWTIFASPSLLKGYKVYNGKTLIIQENATFLNHTPIGLHTYYNADGSMAKQVNENKKFGKFGPAQLLAFLQKEKLINLKTGAGRQYLVSIDFGTEKINPKSNHSWGAPDKGQWSVIYTKSMPFIDHTYIIDSQTGRLISHKNLKGDELVK